MSRLTLFLSGLGLLMTAVQVHAQPHERTVRDTLHGTPSVVSVSSAHASVEASTWSSDSLAYEVRITSNSGPEPASQTQIEVEDSGERLSLSVNYEKVDAQFSFGPDVYGYGTPFPDVHYTIRFPEQTTLFVENADSSDTSGSRWVQSNRRFTSIQSAQLISTSASSGTLCPCCDGLRTGPRARPGNDCTCCGLRT